MLQSRTFLACSAALVLAACATDHPAAPTERVPGNAPALAVQGELTGTFLVAYSGSSAAASARIATAGAKVLRDLPEIGVMLVSGLATASVTGLASQPGIVGVAQDKLVRMIDEPNALSVQGTLGAPGVLGADQSGTLFFPKQWYLRRIRADVAWAPSAGGQGELICILDTGIDGSHVEFDEFPFGPIDYAVPMIATPRFASDAGPIDYNGHGTQVAAIARTAGAYMASVAPDARLCSVKVVSEDGKGTIGDLISGIVWAGGPIWAKGLADVINVSAGTILDLTNANDRALYNTLLAAVAYAHSKGAVIVAAAGNDGLNFEALSPRPWSIVHVPSMVPGVVGVGATNGWNDALWPRSNYGSAETMDLVAPGVEMLSALAFEPAKRPLPLGCGQPTHTCYALGLWGTSYAAPLVSGAAAMVESTVRRKVTSEIIQMTPGAIAQCLRRTADKVGSRSTHGAGRLNVLTAAMTCSRYG